MNRWIIIIMSALLLGGGAYVYSSRSANAEPLEVGAAAPHFETTAALAGKPFNVSLSEKLKKGPVVLYFFPKAFTEGCTIEANMFAEATADFEAAGATVIGMSGDDLETLTKFSVEECRDKFAVARADDAVMDGYQVRMKPTLALTNRTSYVIDQNSKIVMVHSAQDPKGHVQKTLEKVQQLARAKMAAPPEN
ncbi:peroxiredoxin [Parasphingorhabdus litoris]|uniref:thioredoxin-dependent peroxiredoxin n=1 Tax=Parasphingorhabdus litoris TaxID=394733 RepID=A0ABN0ZZE6_9SPHN|nr:peroxiredoxin [Parasphingorhabdus litoris]